MDFEKVKCFKCGDKNLPLLHVFSATGYHLIDYKNSDSYINGEACSGSFALEDEIYCKSCYFEKKMRSG